jgi:hypothetical protein
VVWAGLGALSCAATGVVIDLENERCHAYEWHERAFRSAFESSAKSDSHEWEEASRAYRYGWECHDRPEYRGKAWCQVISDLQKGWIGGDWSDFEFLVRSAWERRASYHGPAIMPAFEGYQPSKAGEAFEETTPAYRFGRTLANDDRNLLSDWKAVEPEARKYWEAINEGTWEQYKGAIHHAWDKVRGKG